MAPRNLVGSFDGPLPDWPEAGSDAPAGAGYKSVVKPVGRIAYTKSQTSYAQYQTVKHISHIETLEHGSSVASIADGGMLNC